MTRKKAQPQKNSTKIRKSIMSAALNVAARSPWEFVSLIEIADFASLSVDEVISVFPSKSDIFAAIIDELDTHVESVVQNYDEDTPVRDRLFDVLMERIEIANQNRDAHISLFKSFGWTRDDTCADIKILKSSMVRMAKCAGLETDGLFGAAYVTGLSIAYVWVLCTWVKDTSSDLGKTMAELDKTLGRIEMVKSMVQSYAARTRSDP